jgi:hypothetical protein
MLIIKIHDNKGNTIWEFENDEDKKEISSYYTTENTLTVLTTDNMEYKFYNHKFVVIESLNQNR